MLLHRWGSGEAGRGMDRLATWARGARGTVLVENPQRKKSCKDALAVALRGEPGEGTSSLLEAPKHTAADESCYYQILVKNVGIAGGLVSCQNIKLPTCSNGLDYPAPRN
jgi:hypothetical protein